LEEIQLLEQQVTGYERKADAGLISRTGPEMTALKREILELRRTLAAFDAGIMPIPPIPIKK
jgi:hypothetical protein